LAVQLALSAEDEFFAKVGLMDALRGVKADGEDVVAVGACIARPCVDHGA